MISLKDQDVFLEALQKSFHFKKSEPVFTEVSKKYGLDDIFLLSKEKGFEVVENFMDEEKMFSDSLWVKK